MWLAHLSANTNDRPRGVLTRIDNYLQMAGVDRFKLAVAERDRPSVSWPNPQASLFDVS